MKLIFEKWQNIFDEEISKTKNLKIISPFIKLESIVKMQKIFDFRKFELLTRFNTKDFAFGGSSLEGLKFAYDKGAIIFGICDLHSKVYLFDERSAIVTSANLTKGGMESNYECGLLITDKITVRELLQYFVRIKNIGKEFSHAKYEQWKREIKQVDVRGHDLAKFHDYGGSSEDASKETSYYLKFYGDGTWKGRKELLTTVRDEIEKTECHYACTFSRKKNSARNFKDGDIVYYAVLTKNPNNYAIFGRAEAIMYVEGRDKATPNEIHRLQWKRKFPVYLRVKNPIFIDGKLEDCVKLFALTDDLKWKSFPSTKEKHKIGLRDINPRLSLCQKQYIQLTSEAMEWLEPKFQDALKDCGTVPEGFIKKLPRSDIKI